MNESSIKTWLRDVSEAGSAYTLDKETVTLWRIDKTFGFDLGVVNWWISNRFVYADFSALNPWWQGHLLPSCYGEGMFHMGGLSPTIGEMKEGQAVFLALVIS